MSWRRAHKARLVFLVKLAVTALILAAFAWKLDFGSALQALSSISRYAVMAALIVVLVQATASAVRLTLVVALFGHRFNLLQSFRLTLESMFFSQTFVSFLGGDALRVWRIHKLGLSASDATGAVLLDRLMGIIANHVCVLATLPWLLGVIAPGPARIVLLGLAAAGLAGIGLLLLLGIMPRWIRMQDYLPQALRSTALIAVLLEASTVGRHLLAHWRDLAPVGLLGLLTVLGNCLTFFLILCGMGIDPEKALYCALIVPAVLEIAMLPISIAGWGVREATAIAAFGAFGVSSDNALAASLAFGLILATVSLLGGIVWLSDRQRIAAQTSSQKRFGS